MKIDSEVKDNAIRIKMNGIIHLLIKRTEFIGFYAWILGNDNFSYGITFQMKTRQFDSVYDTQEKWLEVLKQLDRPDLFVGFEND